jgi:type I restriction enzyme S subunit
MREQESHKGWQAVKFDEIAMHVSVRVNPKNGDEKKYIGLEHLDCGSLNVSRWGSEVSLKGQKLAIKKGDILFAKRNAYLKRVSLAPFDGIFSAHGMVIRPIADKIIPDYLPFFMLSEAFFSRAIAISEGSLSPTIKWKVLANQQFSIPPKYEQEKIVELCSKVQDVECLQSLLNKSNKNLYLSVLTDVFKRGMTDPAWTKCCLDQCAKIQTGLALSSKREFSEDTVEIPYLRVANVYDGRFDLEKIKYVEVTESMYRRFKVEIGDILIAEGGDYDKVGRGHIWKNEVPGVIHQNHLFAIRTDRTKLLPEFFNYLKSSFIGVKFFLGIAQQTTNLATINSSQVKKFPCIFPSIEVQRELVAKLDLLSSYENKLNKKKSSIDDVYKAMLNR